MKSTENSPFLLLCILFSFSFPSVVSTQVTISMNDTETRQEISMTDAAGKNIDGVYRYYKKGEDMPFSGVLFAKYPNGNYSSWQQYVNGIGEGIWINYYENGNYKEIGNYNRNLVEGPIQKFYENGILKAEGTYKDWRIKVGKWKCYDENGILLTIIDYG